MESFKIKKNPTTLTPKSMTITKQNISSPKRSKLKFLPFTAGGGRKDSYF